MLFRGNVHNQAVSAFSSAALEYFASICSLHAGSKAMFAAAFYSAGLVRSFHSLIPFWFFSPKALGRLSEKEMR